MDKTAIKRARNEIARSWERTCEDNADDPDLRHNFDPRRLPGFHDPFAGGGTIPLEAQRLGLDSLATDLNPVAVLMNKAMVAVPSKFAGRVPVNPRAQQDELPYGQPYRHAQGLAADVRYYGDWLEREGLCKMAHLFPALRITPKMASGRPRLTTDVGKKCTVLAWIWVRTVASPNPAFQHVQVPLATTFVLSRVKHQEAYVQPVIGEDRIDFAVFDGKPPKDSTASTGTKAGRGGRFRCLKSGIIISRSYVVAEAKAGRMGTQLMAIVVQTGSGRVCVPPQLYHEAVAKEAVAKWRPKVAFVPTKYDPSHVGVTRFDQLFPDRQIVALDMLSKLLQPLRSKVAADARCAGLPDDGSESGADAYARAIVLYLGLAISKAAGYWSSACIWDKSRQKIAGVFGIQAVKLTYDYVEANGFSGSVGSLRSMITAIEKVLGRFVCDVPGHAEAADARAQQLTRGRVVSTDPPYYDNIAYAELSDFYYVWLRRALGSEFPALFGTLTTPKSDELVASASRQGGKEAAKQFFEEGMTSAMRRLAEQAHPAYPVTVYYAFKQAETRSREGRVSTGWETFLEGILAAGFQVTGTWPVRTEMATRMVARKANALATSVVLVLRRRSEHAKTIGSKRFVRELKEKLPPIVREMQRRGIAPVDMAQAMIGPGMRVFSKYAQVLHVDGSRVTVGEALGRINKVLDASLRIEGSDLDKYTLWAVQWFESYGFDEGPYERAEVLATAKGISVEGLGKAGILEYGAGKVRLIRIDALPDDWDPSTDSRLTVWEATHHLIRQLQRDGVEGAANLVHKLGPLTEPASALCYRLYDLCDGQWQRQAMLYNTLAESWDAIRDHQVGMFDA